LAAIADGSPRVRHAIGRRDKRPLPDTSHVVDGERPIAHADRRDAKAPAPGSIVEGLALEGLALDLPAHGREGRRTPVHVDHHARRLGP